MSTPGQGSPLPQAGAFPLGSRAKFHISGSDAARYLGGQLTNRLPAVGETNQSLFLTVKGKLCAPVFVSALPSGGFALDADADLREPLAARIERYVVADDVVIEDQFTADAGWHVVGFPIADGGAPIARLGVPGFDSPACPDGVTQLSGEDVERLRICRGVPAWGHELDGDTLPHEAGLDRLAVDFHKGCYVGQEVVSRIQSVGRTNRLLRGLLGDFPPSPGATLCDSHGAVVGKITSATRLLGLATSAALGYVSTRTTETSLVVTDPTGRKTGECQIHEFPLA